MSRRSGMGQWGSKEPCSFTSPVVTRPANDYFLLLGSFRTKRTDISSAEAIPATEELRKGEGDKTISPLRC